MAIGIPPVLPSARSLYRSWRFWRGRVTWGGGEQECAATAEAAATDLPATATRTQAQWNEQWKIPVLFRLTPR